MSRRLQDEEDDKEKAIWFLGCHDYEKQELTERVKARLVVYARTAKAVIGVVTVVGSNAFWTGTVSISSNALLIAVASVFM